jgi:hypothetical protein
MNGLRAASIASGSVTTSACICTRPLSLTTQIAVCSIDTSRREKNPIARLLRSYFTAAALAAGVRENWHSPASLGAHRLRAAVTRVHRRRGLPRFAVVLVDYMRHVCDLYGAFDVAVKGPLTVRHWRRRDGGRVDECADLTGQLNKK